MDEKNSKESIIDFLSNIIDNNSFQDKDGKFSLTNNGPHGDSETYLRSTSHFLYLLCFLVEAGRQEYTIKANLAADYLISKDARPMGGAYYCRFNPKKDFSNGLVGQAWVMESLLYASKVLNRSDCRESVNNVFMKHLWNDKLCAWHLLNVDGSSSPTPHGTFNQQVWFAYIGLQIEGNNQANSQARKFIKYTLPNVELYNDGVIYHDSPSYNVKSSITAFINHKIRSVFQNSLKNKMRNKRNHSAAYHAFNLVPLKYMEENVEDNFFESKKFIKAMNCFDSLKYIDDVGRSPYGLNYNPSGYEWAYVKKEMKLLGINL